MDNVGEAGLEIPAAWEQIEIAQLKGISLIIGATDVGKSTFARYLFQRWKEEHPAVRVALLDGDPGQSGFGPPGTQTLTLDPSAWPAGERSKIGPAWRYFIGSTTPHGHMLETVVGAARLVGKARQAGAQAVIYDTSGLIDPRGGGLALKAAKIELLQPDTIFAIQREFELEPLLAPWRRSRRVQIVNLRPAAAVRKRPVSARQAHRAAQFARHFAGARPLTFGWRDLAVFPAPRFVDQRLLAFEDLEGFTLALGIVTAIEWLRGEVTVVTPQLSLEGVNAVKIGDLLVNPDTFQDRRV